MSSVVQATNCSVPFVAQNTVPATKSGVALWRQAPGDMMLPGQMTVAESATSLLNSRCSASWLGISEYCAAVGPPASRLTEQAKVARAGAVGSVATQEPGAYPAGRRPRSVVSAAGSRGAGAGEVVVFVVDDGAEVLVSSAAGVALSSPRVVSHTTPPAANTVAATTAAIVSGLRLGGFVAGTAAGN